MATGWARLPYEEWSATCDTLHAHTQVLGKLAAALAAPEPQLQHAALRVTARGWETLPLPAPDGSGALVVALDLHAHEAVVEHSDGRVHRVALTPDRPVGEVTRGVLEAVRSLGGDVAIDPTPQEVSWSVPLDEDDQHSRVRPGPGRRLLRRCDPRGARAGCVSCAVSRPLDAGQRMVGFVRPGREPVLRPSRRARRPPTSSRETRWMRKRSRSDGGPATPATPGQRSTPMRTRRPDGFAARHPHPRRCTLGGRAGRVRAGLGRCLRQPRPARGRRRLRPLGVPATPARCANGIPRSPPPPRAHRRPSSDH